MAGRVRLIAVVVLTGTWLGTGLVVQSVQPQAPAGQAPPAAGQGPPGGRGPAPVATGRGGGGQGGGARRGGFTQFTRPINQDLLVRGKAVYETNCASCHAPDLRGTADGRYPNLLRSGVALRDQDGVLIGQALGSHRPPLNLVTTDTAAVAEYIHSVHATMGGQGSPPGRNPTNVTLNVLVGDPQAGAEVFAARCGACHSVAGNLKSIASRFSDARALQNAWVSGTAGFVGGGRGGGGGDAGQPATVTLADGSTLDGTLVRQDDFLVILTLADGTRRSFARTKGIPKVVVRDPRAGHVEAIVKLAHEDTTSKMMHDITAYLWTIK